MIYLANIVFVFTAIQVIVSMVNVIFRQRVSTQKGFSELISVLIPARNEEKNIAQLLSDLLKLDYKNIEIIVFDDQSNDGTREIIEKFMKMDSRIKLIASRNLPDGWLGKNYACHTLSLDAQGEYFLFVDADVRIKNSLVERTVLQSQKYALDLLTIFPKQEMKTLGEQITVPFMNYILLTLLPLILVRKSKFHSLSAANGQFMLFKADTYRKVTPHKVMQNKKVEDIEIARFYKQNNLRVACLASCGDVSCRMYTGFNNAINGFSKNVVMFFGNSVLFTVLFWLITTLGFIPVIIAYKTQGLIIYLFCILLIRLFVSFASNQPVIKNLLFIVFHQFSLGVVIAKSIQNHRKKQFVWKGRNIS